MAFLRHAISVSLAIRIADALTILAPTSGEQLNLANSFVVRWQEDSDEATVPLSIDLVNATAAFEAPVLLNIARNVSSNVGDVNVTWPYSVPNVTATYQLYFLGTESGSDIATSGMFNLTLPPGENRTEAGGAVGPINPAITAQDGSRNQGLAAGAIAGIVVGVCVGVLASLVAAWFFWRQTQRRREATRTQTEGLNRNHDKPELGGHAIAVGRFHKRNKTADTDFTALSAELPSEDKKKRIQSHEMEGNADYLRFELPGTPPPTELEANEQAAVEMYAASVHTGRLGSILSAPKAASVRSGSTTLGGTRTFAEALHDLVSEELRRKE